MITPAKLSAAIGRPARRAARYALARANEASTWRGLTLVATGCGAILSPEQQEAIIAGGVMVAGFIGAVFPDKKDSTS